MSSNELKIPVGISTVRVSSPCILLSFSRSAFKYAPEMGLDAYKMMTATLDAEIETRTTPPLWRSGGSPPPTKEYEDPISHWSPISVSDGANYFTMRHFRATLALSPSSQ